MPVLVSEVYVGAFFVTSNQQLRKVTQLEIDDQQRTRVHYLSKSANQKNREFNIGHPIANPPLIDKFVADCDYLLSPMQISELRASNIILNNE